MRVGCRERERETKRMRMGCRERERQRKGDLLEDGGERGWNLVLKLTGLPYRQFLCSHRRENATDMYICREMGITGVGA